MSLALEKPDNDANKPDEGRFVPKYYNEICGSANAGNLLAQIRYWWKINKKKEFSKSLARFAKEIGVTYGQARNAEGLLIELGFVKKDVKKSGYAPQLKHWTFCEDEVERAIINLKTNRSIRAIKNAILSPEPTVSSTEPTVSSTEPTVSSTEPTHKDIILETILNSSSLEAALPESQPVPVQAGEEEDIIYIMENEQPAERPVQGVQSPVKPQSQQLAANDTAINPVDIKSITVRMLEIWNKWCPVAKVSEDTSFSFALIARFNDSFNKSLDEWERYCKRIAKSKLLMGEQPRRAGNEKSFQLRLGWALKVETINKLMNGNEYDSDRYVPLSKDELETLIEKKKRDYQQICDEQISRRNAADEISTEERKCGLKMFGGILKELKGSFPQRKFANRA